MPSCLDFVADKFKVLYMVSIAVKLAGKRISAHNGRKIVLPRSGSIPYRLEIRHTCKVQVGKQVHPALFILPFLRGRTGVYRRGKSKEILYVMDAGDIRFFNRSRLFMIASGYSQGKKGREKKKQHSHDYLSLKVTKMG